MSYNGFISYSHAADGELAPALQTALQRLARPWYRRRALEVFRDETGLSVDPNLWGSIVTALDDSEWFVLLTSPTAATSEWVNREIEHWKAYRPLDRILPVVTEGHWEWDPDALDFTDDSDAVPPALRGVFTDEPRHLDLRWARQESQLELRNGRFRDAAAEVAAPLHGRTKDDLEGEDVRQHRRTIRLVWTVAAALVLLIMAAVIGAIVAVRNADRAEQRAVEADAQRLVAQSQTELARPDLAFLLAAHADRLDPSIDTAGSVLTALATLPELRQRLRLDEAVTAVAESEADGLVWAGTENGDVVAFRFDDGERVAVSEGLFTNSLVEIIATADGDTTNLVATDGLTVATLDQDLEPLVVRNVSSPVFALAVEDKSGRIAGGTGDGEIVIWEQGDAEPAATFSAGGGITTTAVVAALAWGPDGSLIVADTDGVVRRLDPEAPSRPVWVITDPVTTGSWVQALAIVPDGPVVTGGTDGSVGFWDMSDGSLTDAGLIALHAGEVTDLAYTGDVAEAGSIASVAEDGFLLYWNDETGRVILEPLRVDEASANAVAWDPLNPLRGATGGTDGGLLLIDYSDQQRRPIAWPERGWSDVAIAALSPDAERLAVATVESTLIMTSGDDPRPDDPDVFLDALVEHMVFTPDGTSVVAGLGDGTIAVWDGASDAPTLTEAHDGAVAQIAVSPDGDTLASGALDLESTEVEDSTVRLWHLDGTDLEADGEVQAPPFGFGMAFTPDGRTLAIGGQGAFVLHDLELGDTREIDLGFDGVRSMAVDPTGTLLAVGLTSGPVRVYDIESGRPTGDELRHAGRVTGLAFHDDGRVLATVAEDGGFHLWDMDGRRRLTSTALTAVDRGQSAGIPLSTSLSVGGTEAVTASQADGRLVRWSLAVADWIAEGCDLHDRELTEDEQERFGLERAPAVCPP